MLSYDYNHFEVCLSSDKEMTLKEVNELRKDVQRLADEAVRQYKIAKEMAVKKTNLQHEREELEKEVLAMKQKPETEWTAEEKAKAKALEDKEYWERFNYDYND
ncbi:hypothetical protein DRJ16_05260 [Candidatus Woesearchaeota archaeon]|nr:MAG: hypothetical protein DRJ16_05260 [Candidatus Woesearchaeota archaeon]